MEGVKHRHQDEHNSEPRNGDFAFLAVACRGQLFNTRRQEQQERSQHHDAQHFGDNRRVLRVRADRMAGGNNLRHFMHGGAHIDPVGLRGKPVRQQRVHRRVEEDGDGTEDNHCSDGNRHFTGFGFDHRLGGEHGRRAADAAAGADQPAGVFIETKHFLAKEAGDEKGTGERQNVNQNTAHADVGNLGERQAKAVEDDPQAQQMLLGEDHPAVAGLPDFRVDRVADDHPEQDSEGQGAKARAGDGRETTGPQGGAGQSGGQRQAWDKMPQGTMFGG